MTEFPPLPDGLADDPNIDVRTHDLRGSDFAGPDELLKEIIRNTERELNTRGWGQPDWLAAIHADKSSEDGTAFIWLAEMNVPAPLRGNLPDALSSLAMVLTMPIPGIREEAVRFALGDQSDDSVPVGVVIAFKAWGVVGSGPIPEDVIEAGRRGELYKRPDATEQRHVIARMFDGTLLHLVRVRDMEPVFVDDDGGPLADFLAIVTDAVCGLPMAPIPNLN